MRVKYLTGRWRILTMGEMTTVISQDRSAPYRRDVAVNDIIGQLAQTLKVYAPHTMTSQRKWSEPPVGANMLVERPAFLARASRILAREVASAIGAADCLQLEDDIDIQRIAANMIDTHRAGVVVSRTHARLLYIADRLTTVEVGSFALAAVLCMTPAPPPPRLTVDNETSHAQWFAREPALGAIFFTASSAASWLVACGAYARRTDLRYRGGSSAVSSVTHRTCNALRRITHRASPRSIRRCVRGRRVSSGRLTRPTPLAHYGLHITEGDSDYTYFPGLRRKFDAPAALGM